MRKKEKGKKKEQHVLMNNTIDGVKKNIKSKNKLKKNEEKRNTIDNIMRNNSVN